MTLAPHLGMSLFEAQQKVSSREFAKWLAEYRRNPWGEARMDFRFSALLAMMANLQRDPKKRPRAFTWEDFRFEFGPPENANERSVEDLIEVAVAWTKAMGGIDKRVKKPD